MMKKALKDVNIDENLNIVDVPYNTDSNVELFAKELTNRIIGFKWTPKYVYCLFGLKKGIKNYIALNFNHQIMLGKDLIKTIGDFEKVNGTFTKMEDRFQNYIGGLQTNSIVDYETGEIKTAKENTILMGIPYEDRQKIDIKKFMGIIHDMETGRYKAKEFNETEWTTINKNEDNKESGEIYNAYIKKDEIQTLEPTEEQRERVEDVANQVINRQHNQELVASRTE